MITLTNVGVSDRMMLRGCWFSDRLIFVVTMLYVHSPAADGFVCGVKEWFKLKLDNQWLLFSAFNFLLIGEYCSQQYQHREI